MSNAEPAETPQEPGLPPAETPTQPTPDTLTPVLQSLTAAFERFVATVRVPADLSPYRSVSAARGLEECQGLLDQGWDIIHADYCEEVRHRSGVGRQPSVLAWTPYFIMGRRETLLAQDRAAVILAEERRAMSSGMPMADAPEPEAPEAPPATAPPTGEPPADSYADPSQPRGRRVTAQGPKSIGAEGMGALAGR